MPHQVIVLLLGVLLASSAQPQLLFSRRIYKERGISYQQIWTWNPADGILKALTHSPRDHNNPVCVGRTIKFTSPSPSSPDPNLWSFNPATGNERVLGPAPEPSDEPASAKAGCDQFAKRGELEACGSDETLSLSRLGRQIAKFRIEVDNCPIDNHGTKGKCETPIRTLEWTEDSKWLLIGEEGLNDNSTQRQDDYYLVNLATRKLTTVVSAETAFWLPGRDQIVYITPIDLAPLPGRGRQRFVWVQQLMLFDPVNGKTQAITSGLSNNVAPSWCQGR